MLQALTALALCAQVGLVSAQTTASGASSSVATAAVATMTSMVSSSMTVSTAVPSPTVPLNSTVSSLPLPPVQAWCENGGNATYCPGALLQLVELSGIYADSKTFPDKPTVYNASRTFQAFNELPQENVTVQQVQDFVETYFKGEGLELETVEIQNFTANPAILDNITDPLYKGFTSTVNGYWSLLVRQTNESALCQNGECESSLIPLNRSFIVPGGRYREIYYWDSFCILEGLLKSELYLYAYNLIENFSDLIELYGFLPNGGRKYYLNRSQPPVFVQMLNAYVQVTGNVSILERGLRIAETELEWWKNNRTIYVESPYSGKNLSVAHYAARVSAPRPEGYQEDIATVFGAEPALNETERSNLYAELASGAESGYDYSSRWCKQPLLNKTDNNPALRTLNTRQILPVDLNSLLYGDHVLLANLYELYGNSTAGNSSDLSNATSSNSSDLVAYHRQTAENFKETILDLFWDENKLYFYDFNTTANNHSDVYHPGGLFPLWQNITPPALVNNDTAALGVFAGLRFITGKYPGVPSVASVLETGLNWDFPNSWPPHLYTTIKALETIGRVNPNSSVIGNVSLTDFSQIPAGQFGVAEADLPPQPAAALGNNSITYAQELSGEEQGKPWPMALAIEFANRYMQAAFCSWYSTGGGISGLLEPLSAQELNATGAVPGSMGNIFEKFNLTDVDAAGGGGEYTVQIGFGWSNGVILHTAAEYGQYLAPPLCPLISINEDANATMASNSTSAIKLMKGFRLPRN